MDIEKMKAENDIRGLIKLLDHQKHDLQWRAADALGTMGEQACDPLLKLLTFPKKHVRIGAIEALGDIGIPRSVEPLMHTLLTDDSLEVRWVAAVALGEIGDRRAIPPLVESLKNENRYVRFGSARALEQIGWSPETDQDRAFAYIAIQDWDAVKKLGAFATGPLTEMLKDKHAAMRAQITVLLGSIGGVARQSCHQVLRDPDENVRWNGVLASRRCHVPNSILPVELSKRVKTSPSAVGAALLNLIFLGCGYDYLGKWWGLIILEIFLLLFLISQLLVGIKVSVMIWAPITALFALQTYFMVKREAALAG